MEREVLLIFGEEGTTGRERCERKGEIDVEHRRWARIPRGGAHRQVRERATRRASRAVAREVRHVQRVHRRSSPRRHHRVAPHPGNLPRRGLPRRRRPSSSARAPRCSCCPRSPPPAPRPRPPAPCLPCCRRPAPAPAVVRSHRRLTTRALGTTPRRRVWRQVIKLALLALVVVCQPWWWNVGDLNARPTPPKATAANAK